MVGEDRLEISARLSAYRALENEGISMPLNSEVLRNIDGLVRGGFDERDRIIEIFCEEMHEPGELDEAEVTVAVDAAFASLEKDKATWPLRQARQSICSAQYAWDYRLAKRRIHTK
jgi:hypothetical protein